ncbi:MAG: hypothetical protein AAF701_09960, partial [Pseudomonadota bacterium]
MGVFQFNGRIDGAVNMPLGTGQFYHHDGQIGLISPAMGGGMTLTPTAQGIAQVQGAYAINAATPMVQLIYGGAHVTFDQPSVNMILASPPGTSVTVYANASGAYVDRFAALTFDNGGQSYVVLADTSGTGLATYRVTDSGDLQHLYTVDGPFAAQITSLAYTDVGYGPVVVATSG